MKRKLLFAMLTVVAFTGSFFLANHFSNKSVNLPTQVAQGIRWFESLFSDEQEKTKESLGHKQVKLDDIAKSTDKDEQHYSHGEVGSNTICKDTSLGEIKYKKVGDIYTWTDENEIYHVSDKPPKEGEFSLLNSADEKVFDYFSLDVNTENLPYDFNEKLTVKLNKLFEIYGQLLDVSSLKKVAINLRVYASKLTFEQIKKKHNMPTANNSNGFYSHASNQAHLLFVNNDKTMITAAHEATHAVNRAIIGKSPKWLNEGLAEYSEYIKVKGQSSHIYPNNNWTKNGRMTEALLPLSILFTVNDKQWDSELRSRLYATSWAFIYFMMEKPERKEILARIIKSEQQNMCDVINEQKIKQGLGLPLNILQSQFSGWSRLKFKVQSI